MSIKIAIVDDHKIVRDGIKLYLNNDPEYQVCCEAESGQEAIDILDNKEITLALVDINMKGINGVETTRRLIQDHPGLKVIALTMYNDYQHIKAMMDAGARG